MSNTWYPDQIVFATYARLSDTCTRFCCLGIRLRMVSEDSIEILLSGCSHTFATCAELSDLSVLLPVPRTASVPEVAILQASKAIVGTFTAIPLASGIAVGIPSVILLKETLLPSKDIRRSGKKKTVADDKEKRPCQGEVRRVMAVREILRRQSKIERLFSGEPRNTLSTIFEARPDSLLPPPVWSEYINIGSRQDKLDFAILEKFPPSSATTVTSVHKYWTSVWARGSEGADLSKLIKMVEMNTA
ncbi:hypothetical protein Fot_32343 [Forsythia ovata]|uniref:Uncharacterized protein n=1 Tax=Forsythia ovata TaxID=205694 RepID=A0ABD1T7J6_9LAMI